MIPYSACGGKVHFSDGESIDISLLELSPKSFSFRLAGCFAHPSNIDSIELSFFLWDSRKYETVSIDNEQMTLELLKEEKYYVSFLVTVSSETFKQKAQAFSRDYVRYIDYKLNLSDEEISHELCGYPLGDEEEWSSGKEDISERYFQNCNPSAYDQDSLEEYEWGLLMEDEKSLNQYIELGLETYYRCLLKRVHGTQHPLSKVKIKRIYIGNSFCPHVLNDLKLIEKGIDKCLEEKLPICLVLPPMHETIVNKALEDVIYLLDRYKGVDLEIQVNDWGSFELLNKERMACGNVTKGILLNKSRRDPRNKYRQDEKVLNLSYGEKEIYLPYYQTNTGTFCTLHATIVNGDRGQNERIKSCEKPCIKYRIAYPKHLNMIGQYNSLFAFNGEVLDNLGLLKEATVWRERLVINL